MDVSQLLEEQEHQPSAAVPLTPGLLFRKCNKHRGGAGGGAELCGRAEALRLPAPEDLHRAVSVLKAQGSWGTLGMSVSVSTERLACSSAPSICLLVVSSSYLAFRIFRLEQQLCSLNRDYLSRGHRR